MRTIITMLLATALSAPAAASETGAPEWLKGYWLSCDDGAQTAEAWIGDGSGTLVGVNQSPGSFEYMRVAKGANGFSFFGSPQGAPAVEFPAVERTASSATFENPAHDFPQRVRYERRGDVLTGRIEGTIGGETQSMEWRFERADFGAECR